MWDGDIVKMGRKKLFLLLSPSKVPKLTICFPSIILILVLHILSSCQTVQSANDSLPNGGGGSGSTLNNYKFDSDNNFDFHDGGRESLISINVKHVNKSDHNNNGGGGEFPKVFSVVQNISQEEEEDRRIPTTTTETVYSTDNVGKVTVNDEVNVTDRSPVKESAESVNSQDEKEESSSSSGGMTFTTELYKDNTVDGVVAVNQSDVSESVTKTKTEAETNPSPHSNSYNNRSSREDEESSTLLVLRLAQCRANCLYAKSKKIEKLKKSQKYSTYSKKLDVFVSTLKEQIKLSYTECWDTCLLLEIENGENHPAKLVDAVCALDNNNNNTCLSGCQEACEFHHDVQHVAKNGRKKAPLLAAKVDSFLSYNLSTLSPPQSSMRKRGGFQLDLRWPESDGFLVYSVVQHVRLLVKNGRLAWTWRLLQQTTLGTISLNFLEKPKIGDIRVLAANPHNLVHVFSQEKLKQTTKTRAKNSPQTPSEQVHLVKDRNYSSNNNSSSSSSSSDHHQKQNEEKEEDPQDSWHLRKVSMVHQKFLVVVEVTWDLPQNKSKAPTSSSSPSNSAHMDSTSITTTTPTKQGNDTEMKEASDIQQTVSSPPPPPPSSPPPLPPQNQIKCNFLLTWEVSDGILRGNMVTDASTVTISLWPDTIYSIQVGLIDESSNGDKKPLKPWEFSLEGGEPKVTLKSSFLSVNTSEAVYLNAAEAAEAAAAEKPESSSDSTTSESKSVQSVTSRLSESVQLISSSFAQLQQHQHQAASGIDGGGVNDNDDPHNIRNSGTSITSISTTTTTTTTGWRCELASGAASKWFCQLSVSWLVILGSIYGLLFIFSMMVYLFFAFKNYPYTTNTNTSSSRVSKYLKKSTCKLALLQHDFHQHENDEDDDSHHHHQQLHLPHFEDDDLPRKQLDTLSQYNIV